MKGPLQLLVMVIPSAMIVLAENPVIANISIADPHVRIYNNVAYMYSGRDLNQHSPGFVMPDWHIYSSTNLVHWKLETVISPKQTYIGESTSCWAPTAAFANGSYYFYFSDGNVDIGVMRGPTPVGPFIDELQAPMFPTDLTGFWQYDPTVLTDDDGKTYMMFGKNHKWKGSKEASYFIAQLDDHMQGLAEKPRMVVTGDMPENDKPTLHKRNGTYYLSAGNTYGTSANIYGPYTYRGSTSDKVHEANPPGLSTQAHGNYWTWNNQWFHIWCEFVGGREAGRFRDSWMTYVHYRDNGSMVDDVAFLDAHGPTGVGQYNATWNRIEAEWYFGADGITKKEASPGKLDTEFVVEFANGGYLWFPLVHDMPIGKSTITLAIASASPGDQLDVHADSLHGPLLATCQLPAGKASANVSCPVEKAVGGTTDLYLKFTGKGSPVIDWLQIVARSLDMHV